MQLPPAAVVITVTSRPNIIRLTGSCTPSLTLDGSATWVLTIGGSNAPSLTLDGTYSEDA